MWLIQNAMQSEQATNLLRYTTEANAKVRDLHDLACMRTAIIIFANEPMESAHMPEVFITIFETVGPVVILSSLSFGVLFSFSRDLAHTSFETKVIHST